MGRLTWLADELRRAGLKVSEVPGWETRGSAEFHPEGMTWHATAGARTSSAQAEVNVILHGSATALPPIAQLMIYRDGTVYMCAAGRCNHSKVGWDGPNKGLGNTNLLGIEMANDNKGEPWPAVQLDAARRATAAIMRRLGADPMKRLAAHYEHQPYATRPKGEGSTKSDPYGVDMTKERPRVAALMHGEADVTKDDVLEVLRSPEGQKALASAFNVDGVIGAPGLPKPGTLPSGEPINTHWAAASFLRNADASLTNLKTAVTEHGRILAALAKGADVDEQAIVSGLLAGLTPQLAAGIPKDVAQQVVDLLSKRLAA